MNSSAYLKRFQKSRMPQHRQDAMAWFKNCEMPEFPSPLETDIINGLKSVKHHDQYFTVFNLKEMRLEETSGIRSALGYEKKWTLEQQHDIIHDEYFPMFCAFGILATEETNRSSGAGIKPFSHRYIINYPVRKANGKYVWLKQVSVGLTFGPQGHMLRQLNSYTIVSQFVGVTLPVVPRFYGPDGRLVGLEKQVFDKLVKNCAFSLTDMERTVAEAVVAVYYAKQEERFTRSSTAWTGYDRLRNKAALEVSHSEVSDLIKKHLNRETPKMETVRNVYAYKIREKVFQCFNRTLDSDIDIALFLKNLMLLDIKSIETMKASYRMA